MLATECQNRHKVKINYAFVKTEGRGERQFAPTSFLEMSNERQNNS